MVWQAQALDEAIAQLRSGHAAQAQRIAGDVIRRDPLCAEGWFFLGRLAQQNNQVPKACGLVETALKLRPDATRYLAFQAYLLAICQEHGRALQLIDRLEHRPDKDASTWSDLGNACNACGELERAHRAFVAAASLAPGSVEHALNLAMSQKHMGDFDAAEALADRVLAERPREWEMYEFRSGLRRQTPGRNHVAELEALLAAPGTDADGEIRLCYALGKELEDLCDPQRAFSSYARGAARRRARMRYDVSTDVAALERIRSVYDGRFLAQRDAHPCDSEEPVFVLGLPRTGTTLLERILGSHPDVFAAGELQNFQNELVRAIRRAQPQGARDKQSLIEAAAGIDHPALGHAYLRSTRPRTGRTPRFIDKLPLNYLYVGAIARALPRARIIHVERHPMDAAFAIFKTLFTQAYPFSYSLEDLGHYYVAYEALMRHWHDCLGERLLRVRYEELVADTEVESRRVVHAIGLDWHPDCLRFHQSAVPSNTASAVQVRERVYRSSVGKWRAIADRLQPFADVLSRAGLIPPP